MKHLIVTLTAIASMVAFAEDSQTPEKPRMTAEERVAKMGGFVIKPGSQQGTVAVIDTQSRVDMAEGYNEIFVPVKRLLPINLSYAKMAASDPIVLKAAAKATFAIVVVDDATTPSTMVLPDDGVAVVNVAKLTAGLKLPEDQKMYVKRCTKAALRAYVLLCGGGGSRYPGHVAAAHSAQDLDLAHEKLPIDIQESIKKYLEAAGVTPARRTIYQRACQEGWAPAPTNEVQKAIWTKVHEPPTNPIRIKYDPKIDGAPTKK